MTLYLIELGREERNNLFHVTISQQGKNNIKVIMKIIRATKAQLYKQEIQ